MTEKATNATKAIDNIKNILYNTDIKKTTNQTNTNKKKVRKKQMCKAGFVKKGNIKLGNMYTFSKLFGSQEFYINAWNFSVKGTCGKYCTGCCQSCYVRKSYRYGSVILNHATNTIAMRENMTDLFSRLDGQLTRAKIKPKTVRINQSGEIESKAEIINWIRLAAEHKETQFYLYTKAFDIVIPVLETEKLPENFTCLISVWHDYGIREFKRVEKIPNCKAFVYNDGFNYAAAGLTATTKCHAYKGTKLNHEITCDKCKKCFSRRDMDKVILCDSH